LVVGADRESHEIYVAGGVEAPATSRSRSDPSGDTGEEVAAVYT
jgi:hypothetical protein